MLVAQLVGPTQGRFAPFRIWKLVVPWDYVSCPGTETVRRDLRDSGLKPLCRVLYVVAVERNALWP